MKHEIDLKKYQIHTDLVIESCEKEDTIKSKIEYKDNIKITTVNLDEKSSILLSKKIGEYITIEFDDVTDSSNQQKLTDICIEYLKKLLKDSKIKESDSCFIIGLGNEKSTPDSLGPLTIDNIIVTNHIYELNELDKSFRRIWAISPGVKGQTGIETKDYIASLIEKLKPDFIITIDALAAKSIERVNKTIQMTNTGIAPGSGIGNSREDLSFETLNVPVIAIGIPTVVDAVTIVSDTIHFMHKQYTFNKKFMKNPMSKLVKSSSINYLKEDMKDNMEDRKNLLGMVGTLSEEETRKLIYEVLTPIGYNMMITPKEIDFVIQKLSDVISNMINFSLHKIK